MLDFEWSGVRFTLVKCSGGVLDDCIPMHCHSENSYELHFILGGEGTLFTDFGEYKMRRAISLLPARVSNIPRSEIRTIL